MNNILLQFWEESEKGWGTRPDGASIHIDNNYYLSYVNDIYNKRGDIVPDEYDRVVGSVIEVKAKDNIFNLLESSKSIRIPQYQLNNLLKIGDIII